MVTRHLPTFIVQESLFFRLSKPSHPVSDALGAPSRKQCPQKVNLKRKEKSRTKKTLRLDKYKINSVSECLNSVNQMSSGTPLKFLLVMP